MWRTMGPGLPSTPLLVTRPLVLFGKYKGARAGRVTITGQGAAGLYAEQQGTLRVSRFEIIGDGRRIVHDLAAIDDDRHAAGIGLRQLVLLGEPPRHSLDFEPLMGERHAGAPAERTEPPVRLSARKVVKGDRHAILCPRCVGALLCRPPSARGSPSCPLAEGLCWLAAASHVPAATEPAARLAATDSDGEATHLSPSPRAPCYKRVLVWGGLRCLPCLF